jgi:mannose-6-phosphate isomerase-like protein (cupin superfamily)
MNQWHQLANESDKPCKVIEIQYGKDCLEDDIERMNDIDYGDIHSYL